MLYVTFKTQDNEMKIIVILKYVYFKLYKYQK